MLESLYSRWMKLVWVEIIEHFCFSYWQGLSQPCPHSYHSCRYDSTRMTNIYSKGTPNGQRGTQKGDTECQQEEVVWVAVAGLWRILWSVLFIIVIIETNKPMSVYFWEKKITQAIFCTVFHLTAHVFYHVWYVLLPERDDTNFVYRDRFFCKWYKLFWDRNIIIAFPICLNRSTRFPTSIFVHWSYECVTLDFRFHFVVAWSYFFVWPDFLILRTSTL